VFGGELEQRLNLGGGADGEDFVFGTRHGTARSNSNANVLPYRRAGKPNEHAIVWVPASTFTPTCIQTREDSISSANPVSDFLPTSPRYSLQWFSPVVLDPVFHVLSRHVQ
jgi:hypothetical protein